MKKSFLEKFNLGNEIIILDGAMGTMLQKSGLKPGVSPCLLSATNPGAVLGVHKSYVEAGSNIIASNTFEANRLKLAGTGYGVSEIVEKSVEIAKKAAGDAAYVALDVGPVGELLAPAGSLAFESCVDIFKEVMVCGEKAGADLIFLETIFDLYELKAAVLAARENTNLPVFASMTFQENRRTFTGCPASAAAILMEGLGVDAVGINCSLGPAQLYETVREMTSFASIPVLVKPNAGLPSLEGGETGFDVSPDEFVSDMKKLHGLGVSIFGGCCGTTPEYIHKLANALKGEGVISRRVKPVSAICSGTKTVVIDSVNIIGERINPTGKPKFKEALLKGDMNYVLKQGVEQISAGADILDVNVGMPGIDETETMKNAVISLQAVTDSPLQIDSSNPACLEAALRVYNGKPIVNSVNGEEKSLEAVLPIVKKYGAAVVGLTLDEAGIPDDTAGRVKIAQKILNRALSLGIKKQDVFIDCLTLTVSAQPDSAKVTLECLKFIRENLGLKTVLGVSNISFGLPNRESLNRAFLTLAIGSGLNLPIINPSAPGMAESCYASKALLLMDENCADYISKNSAKTPAKPEKETKTETNKPASEDIKSAIKSGLPEEASRIAAQMLGYDEPLSIINGHLIPALDEVGNLFENGTFFLPQLLQSAEAAKAAFTVINTKMEKTGSRVSKGKIILATVKGDIHDIGKNIVKAVLENYGYEILDLGRDVPADVVTKAAVSENVGLVGLSALMTTTLDSMEKTIKALRGAKPDCKIIVGGAVLTEDYAHKIGADFYAGDAKAAVDCAKKVYN
ncbi:MAG: homocysteine S-methyltransferase family protein [Clostridiales bacterium]|jgi:5-methyltetrahydrofolate--homocysteine methyltransferase|nr:homocysteine S-methyltransferase family protein [Clostridiales bacterium]